MDAISMDLAIKIIVFLTAIAGLYRVIASSRGPGADSLHAGVGLITQAVGILFFMLLPFAFIFGVQFLTGMSIRGDNSEKETDTPSSRDSIIRVYERAVDSLTSRHSLPVVEANRLRAVLMMDSGYERNGALERLAAHLMRATQSEGAFFAALQINSRYQRDDLLARMAREFLRRGEREKAIEVGNRIQSSLERSGISSDILQTLDFP